MTEEKLKEIKDFLKWFEPKAKTLKPFMDAFQEKEIKLEGYDKTGGFTPYDIMKAPKELQAWIEDEDRKPPIAYLYKLGFEERNMYDIVNHLERLIDLPKSAYTDNDAARSKQYPKLLRNWFRQIGFDPSIDKKIEEIKEAQKDMPKFDIARKCPRCGKFVFERDDKNNYRHDKDEVCDCGNSEWLQDQMSEKIAAYRKSLRESKKREKMYYEKYKRQLEEQGKKPKSFKTWLKEDANI